MILTDFFKVVDILVHGLRTAKLNLYGKQRTNICTSFSKWVDISREVPQICILGHADDNTPFFCDRSSELVIAHLENDSQILLNWFKLSYPMKTKIIYRRVNVFRHPYYDSTQ